MKKRILLKLGALSFSDWALYCTCACKNACIRQNTLHQLTSNLVKNYDEICIEDLNVKGMVKNRKLSRAISDMGFYEFKRQLVYKANQCLKIVKSVGRFFPSSKTCSVCDAVNHNLTLSMRSWQCDTCQTVHDRDVNAAKNILQYADEKHCFERLTAA